MFVLACPLIAIFCIIKPKTAPPEPSHIPLVAATRVSAAPQWAETPLSGNIPYQWYSQSSFLYCRYDHSLGAATVSRGEHDVTGAVLRSWQSIGGDLEDTGPTGPADWMLSPDRRWLLTYLGVPGKRRWAAISLDGKQRRTYPARFGFRPLVCWKGDSSGWVELFLGSAGPTAASYSVAANAPTPSLTPLATNHEGYYGRPVPLGGTIDNGIVIATWAEDERHRVPMHIIHPGSSSIPSVRTKVLLPRQADFMEIELSPDGRRLAWVFVVPNHRRHGLRLPFFKSSTPDIDQQLWVSDLDGGKMHRIAAGDSVSKEELTTIHFVRWLPDGKTLSFVDHDSIYTVTSE